MKTAQLRENREVLGSVRGEVKLTRKIVIPPLDTIHISGITSVRSHFK